MSIVVFGGDGYLGWPLSLKLALAHPKETIYLVDNLSRRRIVGEAGGQSLTPIPQLQARIDAFGDIFGQENMRFIPMDITAPEVDDLLRDLKPRVVYHLAQQASAPWSMSSVERACDTVRNNELGNMRVLWGMRAHVPDAHLIKLGSFGEYFQCGLDIPEGYFQPTYKGKVAPIPAPFPRGSDDIYHITKVNDSNFIAMACRKWELRVTDVMQSTIFGVATRETIDHPRLYTRFDYDSFFGTVVNRFLTQTVANYPMTVYGSGHQRTGLMGLDDSLSSLCAMATDIPDASTHRVINHVTEQGYSIIELAEEIAQIAEAEGFRPKIERGNYDPRGEQPKAKLGYKIEADYVSGHITPIPIAQILKETFKIVAGLKEHIDAAHFPPRVQW